MRYGGQDDATAQWMRRNGFKPSTLNQACHRLYGRDMDEAMEALHIAHMTPWGNTRHGARRELSRLLNSRDQFAAVAHLFR